ncbi:MAG TPA: hypothetical protein VM366_07435 [Anaerolineae bacterium]|nr:hypothetical protein [Anaerolineae bacterium]
MSQNYPSIGLLAVLKLSGFEKEQQKYTRLVRDMEKATKQAADTMNKDMRQGAAQAQNALAGLSRATDADIRKINELVGQGYSLAEAMAAVQKDTSGAAGTVTILGKTFSVAAVAAATLTLAIGAGLKAVQQSLRDYTAYAEAVRVLHYQTGLLAEEASGWTVVAQAAGISSATFERSLTSLLGKAEELQADLKAGRENTSDFGRAVDILGLRLSNADGTLRSTDELLAAINARFQALGPGATSASLATDLFGYSGRALLPLLVDQNRSLQDWIIYASEVGATIDSADLPSYEAWRTATLELTLAGQGLGNELAQSLIPTLTSLATWTTNTMRSWRELNAEWGKAHGAWLGLDTALEAELERARAAGDTERVRQLERLSGIQSEVTRSEAELAQQRFEAGQAAARAAYEERQLAKEREKTLDQLADLREKLGEQLLDLERSYSQRLEDVERQRGRDELTRALQLHWRLIDLQQDATDARLDAVRAAAEKAADAERDTWRALMDAEQDAREDREDAERDHMERLADIRQDYLDTVQEAARKNDAVAVARAMREQAREQRDEQKRYTEEQGDLARNLDRERAEIQEDAAERASDQAANLARTLRNLEDAHTDRLAELALQGDRERTLRQIAEANQEADLILSFQRQEAEALLSYGRQRTDLGENLGLVGAEIDRAIRNWGTNAALVAGEEATKIAKAVAVAWTSEINRYAFTLPYSPTSPEILQYKYLLPQPQAERPPIVVAQPNALGEWSIPGHPMIQMAEGGIVHATSPTTVMFGEAGPETGYFVPGGASSLSVHHTFGGMAHEFLGLPGGLNTQQMEQIAYEAITKVAKDIVMART